ncbi:hypothetical protein V6N12_065008 [Hibiscus sabdariffa]|uniref:Uncharacterized protein n=1 Tax=Hibiscus sabdariffa TaxID=183260 RepID=A0ABR2G7G4_9ROSI
MTPPSPISVADRWIGLKPQYGIHRRASNRRRPPWPRIVRVIMDCVGANEEGLFDEGGKTIEARFSEYGWKLRVDDEW